MNDTSLFVLKHHRHLLYLLVYVDDIIITGDDDHVVDLLVQNVAKRFSLKDLGPLTYFLGVEIQPHPYGLVCSQHRYIQSLLHCTNMSNSWPLATSLPPGRPPTLAMGELLLNPSEYRATVASHQYLSLTRPNLSFVVNKLSQFMHKPTKAHWKLVKRLLRYLSGTSAVGLLLHHQSPAHLHAFSDADWGGGTRMTSPPLVLAFYTLVEILSHGHPINNKPLFDHLRRLNIVLWLTRPQKSARYVHY